MRVATEPIRPNRLRGGDQIRVIAPASSLAIINEEQRQIAESNLSAMGLVVTFGEHVEECDRFDSTTISSRVDDLHAAFADTSVKAILSVIGGYNANQLLPYLDWDLIAANPKIFCGYSDITVLSNAIWSKTGLITYSGPHFSTFGMRHHLEQTAAWFRETMFDTEPVGVAPAGTWSDDPWFQDQDNRDIRHNDGYWIMARGDAGTDVGGTLLGGNLCTLNLLQGTQYMPLLDGSILFVEDDFESHPSTFDRDLTSLIQQPGFDGVRGLLIGRFQTETGMDRSTLQAILASKRELDGLPIVANVDFGHTDPVLTIPVGGRGRIQIGDKHATLMLGL